MNTLLKLLVIALGLNLFSCGANSTKSDLKFFPVEKEAFNKFLNQTSQNENRRSGAATADLQKDIHIVNNDYPFEISLYDDGTWYYNLDNLGDGKGTWKFNAGKLELYAERMLFDMYVDILAADSDASNVLIQFADRHGPQTLKMEKRNIEVVK